MRLDECFEQGLLRREPPDATKVKESIELAKHFIERASGNRNMKYHDIALICAYNSMLQSSRALLFRDGIKERSHVCIVIYLSETYGKKALIPERLINILDMTRKARHKTQYAGRIGVTEFESSNAIRDAKEFLAIIESLLGHPIQNQGDVQ